MKYICFFLLIVLVCSSEVVSGNDLEWNNGVVVLVTGESFEAELSYIHKTNVLLCRQDDKVKAYPAHLVKTFFISDQKSKSDRIFVSQDFPEIHQVKRKVFLEVVLLGQIPIYRKANMKKKHDNINVFTDYDYYAYIENSFVPLSDFKKKIYPLLLEDYRNQIKQFVKDEKLKSNKIMDQIRLIGYYNSSVITDEQANVDSK